MSRFILFLSLLFFGVAIFSQCGCKDENFIENYFKDTAGNDVLNLCISYNGLLEGDYFESDSISLINCANFNNLLESSGDDVFKIERWDDVVILTRYKTLLANNELNFTKIPLLSYKIVPNKKGSFDIFVFRVIAIPTMDGNRWENVFEESKEKIEQGEIDKQTLAKILFSSLFGIREATDYFFELKDRIEDEPLKYYYDELLEVYDIYNHIKRKGKKILSFTSPKQ